MKNTINIGDKFGSLTVTENSIPQRYGYVVTRCVCGNEKVVYKYDLFAGTTVSCGCGKRQIEDLTGKVFGRWTVLKLGSRGKWNKIKWLCRCECGNEKEVMAFNLRNGTSQSCGCLAKENVVERMSIHRLSGNLAYNSYKSMVNRCLNDKDPGYKDYGARGITVCERWLGENGLLNFLTDMGNRPSLKFSLDRINPNEGYFPENCRWADAKTQGNNKTNNKQITYLGETKNLTEWAETLNINYTTLHYRLASGWSVERAFEEK